jgi:hypothetical protein
MKLLDRRLSDSIQIDEGGGTTRMKFLFLMANRQTANGNIYSPETLKAAAGEFNRRVERSGPAYGSPGHLKEGPEISDVSHMIEKVSWDEAGQGLFATVKLLPTQRGRNIGVILANKGRVGVSARGDGEKDASGNVSKYRLKGVDFTLSPSTGLDVGEEHIYESAALDEARNDLAEARFRAALASNYKGDFETYKRDVFLPLLEAARRESAEKKLEEGAEPGDGDPPAGDIADVTDAEADLVEDALAAAVDEKFGQNVSLEGWVPGTLILFDIDRSEYFEAEFDIGDGGIKIGEPEKAEA